MGKVSKEHLGEITFSFCSLALCFAFMLSISPTPKLPDILVDAANFDFGVLLPCQHGSLKAQPMFTKTDFVTWNNLGQIVLLLNNLF